MEQLPSVNTIYSSLGALQFDMTQRGVSDLLSCDMARYQVSNEGGYQNFMHYRCPLNTPTHHRCRYGADAVQLPDGRFRISRRVAQHKCSIDERTRRLEQHRARAKDRIEKLEQQISSLEREKEEESGKRNAEEAQTSKEESLSGGEPSNSDTTRKRKHSARRESISGLPESLAPSLGPPEPSTLPPHARSSQSLSTPSPGQLIAPSTSTENPDLESIVQSFAESPAQVERVLAKFKSVGIVDSDRLLACLLWDKAHSQVIWSKLELDGETKSVMERMDKDLKGTALRSKKQRR
ncbi:hypothetical protein JCM3765_000861 [Sporobolomyces pararoseus]